VWPGEDDFAALADGDVDALVVNDSDGDSV
jgi:hypothetical protein